MKKNSLIGLLVIASVFINIKSFSDSNVIQIDDENKHMKISMKFNNQEVVINMEDNPAAQQIIELLPAEFEFSDFAGEEKIANFSSPLDLKNAPRGMVAAKGKMFIYAPWGNMGFFYKDHDTKLDKNLIPLGTIEKGIEHLSSQKANFKARLEIIK